jgi:DNA-binding GntR family transcriptional regulator
MGLAEIALNRGARVRKLDPAAAEDMVELHVQLVTLAARNAARRGTDEQAARIGSFVDMMEHVAEIDGPTEDFQHLRIGFKRALFEAAGDVLAERLRSAAPVTPHHGRAMQDIADRAGKAEVAAAAREVLRAVQDKMPDAAAGAAERMLRRHAERTLV